MPPGSTPLAGAQLCLTAEGRIDRGTLTGKVVATVADKCARASVKCIAVGGIVDRGGGGRSSSGADARPTSVGTWRRRAQRLRRGPLAA